LPVQARRVTVPNYLREVWGSPQKVQRVSDDCRDCRCEFQKQAYARIRARLGHACVSGRGAQRGHHVR